MPRCHRETGLAVRPFARAPSSFEIRTAGVSLAPLPFEISNRCLCYFVGPKNRSRTLFAIFDLSR
jgi:hypothetical protein